MNENFQGDQEGNHFRFLFVGHERQYKPLQQLGKPHGPVCELRSIPGDVRVWAQSEELAVKRLHLALDAEFKKVGGVEVWYRNALTELTKDDHDRWGEFLKIALTSEFSRNGEQSYEFARFQKKDLGGCQEAI